VGIGTSVPEFSINLAAVFGGSPGLGLGTVIGSNTFNILFIIGVLAVISPIVFKKEYLVHDLLFNAGAIFVAIFFAFLPVLGDPYFYGITRSEGVVIFLLFIAWLVFEIGRGKEKGEGSSIETKFVGFGSAVVMVLVGIIGVFIGGHWVVSGAETLANALNISRSLFGLSIVAVGTSLPELSVSISALLAGKKDIAVGNIIGSNIFDFLGILGTVSLLRPIPFPENMSFDIFMTAIATILLGVVVFVGKRYHISRSQGLFFIIIYLIYLCSLFF